MFKINTIKTKKLITNWPEFIAVQNNLKKISKLEFPNIELIKLNFLKKLDIYYNKHEKNILISKKKETINLFKKLNSEQKTIKLGDLLNYPKCCTKNFKNNFNGNDADLIKKNYEQSTIKNFLLNDVFPIRLIYHFPCKYNCLESLTYAKKLLIILKKENPKLVKFMLTGLKMPCLIFEKRYFIFFSYLKKQKTKYQYKIVTEQQIYKRFFEIIKIKDFNNKNLDNITMGFKSKNNLVKTLKTGNYFEIEKKYIKIYRDEKLIKKFSSKSNIKLLIFK